MSTQVRSISTARCYRPGGGFAAPGGGGGGWRFFMKKATAQQRMRSAMTPKTTATMVPGAT
eukprot:scaffold70308_cov91-Phaeocystis_antarctica.AAC.1